jgi:hypothetical protein
MRYFLILFILTLGVPACSKSTDGGAADSTSGETTGDALSGDTPSNDTKKPGSCVVAENQCLSDSDCDPNGEYCGAPGQSVGCGACFGEPDQCAGDADCKTKGEHFICTPHPCACGDPAGDGKTCNPGCQADSECSAWQSCNSGRCNAKNYGDGEGCPVDFFFGEFGCQRHICGKETGGGSTDEGMSVDCEGCCVQGHCYDTPGSCLLPVP